MQPTQPITHLLNRLWQHISPRRRKQFMLLLVVPTNQCRLIFINELPELVSRIKIAKLMLLESNPLPWQVFDASIFFGIVTHQEVQVVALSFYEGIDSCSHRD
jgi:hypothetical protein